MRKLFTKRFAQAFVLLLCGVLVLSCIACKKKEPTPAPVTAPTYVSPYDWSSLVYENGRISYVKDGTLASLSGIDVSEHQGEIDWNAVAADGIDYAIIRLGNRGSTDGLVYLDDYFYTNLENAGNAGILVGVYFFSQALDEDEAVEEAQTVLRALEGIPLDYPVFFDYEPVDIPNARANDLTDEQLSLNAQAFCETIEAGGLTPMLYGTEKNVDRIDAGLRERYGVWLAEYDVKAPSAEMDFTMWQYTSSGTVAGIDTSVDMDIQFLHP